MFLTLSQTCSIRYQHWIWHWLDRINKHLEKYKYIFLSLNLVTLIMGQIINLSGKCLSDHLFISTVCSAIWSVWQQTKAPQKWLLVGDSPHKGPVTRKAFPWHDVIMHRTVRRKQSVAPILPLAAFRSGYWRSDTAIMSYRCLGLGIRLTIITRADSRFVPSQWETALLCNDVSHWLDASLESALITPASRQKISCKRFGYPVIRQWCQLGDVEGQKLLVQVGTTSATIVQKFNVHCNLTRLWIRSKWHLRGRGGWWWLVWGWVGVGVEGGH